MTTGWWNPSWLRERRATGEKEESGERGERRGEGRGGEREAGLTLSVHLLALEEIHQLCKLLLRPQYSLAFCHIQVVVRETNQ